MPPKSTDSKTGKQGGKKDDAGAQGQGQAAAQPPQDEYDLMDLKELHDELRKATLKYNEIRRNRNYFQLERDQVYQFYTIVEEEIDKTEAHIRNIEAQMERMQEMHKNDIRVYLQRVVHLEYEHKNNIDAIATVGEKDMAELELTHAQKESALLALRKAAQEELRKESKANEAAIQDQREREKKALANIRAKFEAAYQELVAQHEARLAALKEELELRRKVCLHEIEERKNSHINTLIWNHEAKYQEMRQYYNSITRDNVRMIQVLIQNIEELRRNQLKDDRKIEKLDDENQKVEIPLEEAKQKVKLLESKLVNFKKDQQSLEQAKARHTALQRAVAELAVKHRQLQAELAEAQRQRDALYKAFEVIVLSAQRQASARSDQLEAMLTELQDQYRTKNAQFAAILRASNLDPVVLQNVTRKLDDVLSAKNEQIDALRYEVAKATKAHDDLVRMYEAKMKQFNIPTPEGGLEPLLVDKSSNSVAAGLII